MSKCGKCGEDGHNARSCGKAAAAAGVPKEGRVVPKKKSASTRKAVAAGTAGSVTDALLARREQLKQELTKLDGIIEAIGELGL
jgi:hypothetical protein